MKGNRQIAALLFWSGIGLVGLAVVIYPPRVTIGLSRERVECKQERHTAVLTHGKVSDRCRQHDRRSYTALAVLVGAFAMLVIARRLKPNKAD